MPRLPFQRVALLTASAALLLALRWMPEKKPIAAPAAPPAALWTPRAPALAVAAPGPSSPRRPWLAQASALTPVNLPANVSLQPGARLRFPLPGVAAFEGVVRLAQNRPDGGVVIGGRLDDGGTFTLGRLGSAWTGVILPREGKDVFRLFVGDDGGLALATVPRESVLCAALPRGPRPPGSANLGGSSTPAPATASAVSVPLLNSRPDAEPVIFLDFDGATVTDPTWNGGETIVAADSGLGLDAITEIWRRVAEDYRPFRINVTTDPARYAAARPMQRMRCIITTSNEWYGEVGGVAGLYSWPHAGVPMPYFPGQIPYPDDTPCWAFTDQNFFIAAYIALAVSHEVGHTFGLFHDGLVDAANGHEAEYYGGHGSGATSWGPIMGAPYNRALIQWSRDNYAGTGSSYNAATNTTTIFSGVGNNPENDVAIISGIENHTGFAPERRGSTLADAGRLAVAADGVTVDHRGLIETGGAESWLLFAAGPGAANLALVADEAGDNDTTNVDASLTITTVGGAVIAAANTTGTRFPSLSTTLPAAGVYVLRVKSGGEGSPAAGGYSAYGSIGRFRVQGLVPAPSGVAPLIGGAARAEGRVGETFSYQIEAAGTALVYAATGLPGGLAVDSNGGVTGTPTASGAFSVQVSATNAAGSATRTVTFAIAESSLAAALDAPALAFSTGGERPWRTVAEGDAPRGVSAARSGEVLDNFQQTWIETTVNGPGRLRWRWRVSSEEDYDFFHATLDGDVIAAISGETIWEQRTLQVPAGSHTLRWSYDKDPFLAVGADAAWLDDVRWDRGYELWAESAGFTGAPATGPAADPDGDALVNLLEYAFARSPATPDGLGDAVSVAPSTATEANGALEIAFVRPAAREDLRYVVEVSGDLLNWARGHAYGAGATTPAAPPTVEVAREPLPGGAERIRVRDGGAGARRFIRVRVERD